MKRKLTRKKAIWLVITVILLSVAVYAGFSIYDALYAPSHLFSESEYSGLPALSVKDARFYDASLSELKQEDAQDSPTSVPSKTGIVNILLMGIDEYADGTTTSGTETHADAILLLAVDLKSSTVNLISIPRDTITGVPGVYGLYKVNSSLNVGGGVKAQGGTGFLKVCETVGTLLGGIDVDYYCALRYDTVLSLVDAIGGVDYDVDISAVSMPNTPELVKGPQHMDGALVLAYLRARKNITSGNDTDVGRVDRQKRMMIAIFTKLKSTAQLKNLPSILSAVSDGFFTNLSVRQISAMALFAMNIDTESIGMHSLYGKLRTSLSWNFCFTDQENRISLIQTIYGITVPELQNVSFAYAKWLDAYGFRAQKYIRNAETVGAYAYERLTNDEAQQTAFQAFKAAYTAVSDAYDKASASLDETDGNRLKNALKDLKNCVLVLADVFAYEETDLLSWTVYEWWNDPSINEVVVDFA